MDTAQDVGQDEAADAVLEHWVREVESVTLAAADQVLRTALAVPGGLAPAAMMLLHARRHSVPTTGRGRAAGNPADPATAPTAGPPRPVGAWWGAGHLLCWYPCRIQPAAAAAVSDRRVYPCWGTPACYPATALSGLLAAGFTARWASRRAHTTLTQVQAQLACTAIVSGVAR